MFTAKYELNLQIHFRLTFFFKDKHPVVTSIWVQQPHTFGYEIMQRGLIKLALRRQPQKQYVFLGTEGAY